MWQNLLYSAWTDRGPVHIEYTSLPCITCKIVNVFYIMTNTDNDSDKRQTRPLVREGALQRQDRDCQTVINIWS
jgi:hypothetical protein